MVAIMPCGDLLVAAGTGRDTSAPQDLSIWRLQLHPARSRGISDLEECCAHLTEPQELDAVSPSQARRGGAMQFIERMLKS